MSDTGTDVNEEHEMTGMNAGADRGRPSEAEIQVVADESGFALIGEPTVVELFLATYELPSKALDRPRLASSIGTAANAVAAASVISAQSGRWVKLTEKSAQQLKALTPMRGSTADSVRAVAIGNDGRISSVLEFSKHASVLGTPAVLAGLGGVMSQMAMQQQMDEISEYLAVIDEKVDDVLRAQKDAALADMIGVDLVIDEAMTIRAHVGGVSEVTWSKVQATSMVVGRTQAYALRQLDALAEKLERKNDLGDLAKATRSAELAASEWLAVLAHCFRLQEAIAVLEIDRVLDANPEQIEQHRVGLEVARGSRRDLIRRSTEQLIHRMNAAAARANRRVLLNPLDSPAVVRASNQVAAQVTVFHRALGIEGEDASVDTRRWLHAAGDLRDSALDKGAQGVDLGKRGCAGARGRARSLTNRVAHEIAERTADRDGATDED